LHIHIPFHVFGFFFSSRNIVALLNAFDLADGSITQDNYDGMLASLNATAQGSAVIRKLDLHRCDLQTFLSEVGPDKDRSSKARGSRCSVVIRLIK